MALLKLQHRVMNPEIAPNSTDDRDRLNLHLYSLRTYFISGFPHYFG
ncbi:hypothetical protein [Yoonia sp.]